jgi:hypothetical protein
MKNSQNCAHEGIKGKLNSRNISLPEYWSVQSPLMGENEKIHPVTLSLRGSMGLSRLQV